MNQDYYTSNNDQKPNSRSSSVVMSDADLEATKRRRLVESAPASSNNIMFRPTPMQSALLQKQLTSFNFLTSSAPASNYESPSMTRSQSSSTSNSLKSESPTPIHSMTNLHIAANEQQQEAKREKTRHELLMDQHRLREEYKKRQQETLLQAQALERIKVEERKRLAEEQHAALKRKLELERQAQEQQAQQQAQLSQTTVKPESDDEIMVDEEMTNRNVCIGMVKTDIVVEKSPLILIRDDQYEIVSLESEGKLNTDNYSFKVTSRSLPARFYGWVPFKDTKVLGPLVDHRLIWWDAVIPRGKATDTRTPLCIILYCRPDLLGTIAKYFESQRLYLKTPPFYNPACRYSNPHHHIIEQQQQLHQQQQMQQYQAYQSNYAGYQYQSHGPYTSNHRYSYNNGYRNEDGRQTQKDIEMLLSSIPSDVPQILLKKKKKEKRRREKLNADVIEILDDEEEEADNDELEEEEEEEDSGYVEGLECHLMDHQIKGVSWMIDRENNESSNGGILADMGLGKTIQTIALMASTMISAKSPSSSTSADNKTEEKEEKEVYEGHRITLIVTPLALIHQWVDEIVSKTEEGKLRILKHHGPNRTKDPAVFKDYDVIVTTYQVVASDMPSIDKKRRKKKKIAQQAVEDDFIDDEGVEDDEEKSTTSNNSSRNNSPFPAKFTPLKKDHGPLFQLKWYRVVLDEAQFIKNRVTKVSLSCASLSSVKRWCLTGTPIQNNVDELYSLLRFLKIQPLSDYSTFKKTISVPIMNGDTQIAMSRLKAVLMAVMLRRTKSVLSTADATKDTDEPMPSSTGGSDTPTTTTTGEETENSNGEENTLSKKLTLQLPSRTKQDVLLRFSDHEKALYDLLSRKTKDTIQSMVGNQSRYMNMLCLLLRLRQACDHPQLILKSIDNEKDVLDIVSSDAGTTNHWSQSQRICELCGRSNNQDESSPYCFNCMDVIKSTSPDKNDLFKTSTKIRKILEILKATRETNPGEKTIIFSQFTSMLDLMQEPLKREGFNVCRYDGSMSSQLRERSLTTLKYDSKCTVMLISLKCGSLGLNLTAANRVILVDIWWNPAVEEQAIDRVHRIGQRLPVHVTRLLIDNTVELKIIKLQEKKAQLSKGALGDGLVKNAKLTASEIRSLFDI